MAPPPAAPFPLLSQASQVDALSAALLLTQYFHTPGRAVHVRVRTQKQ